jgi:hypothetical protein
MSDIFSSLPEPLCSRAIYSVKEVCKIANMSRASLFREFQTGALKRTLYGRKARVSRTDLIDWIAGAPFRVEVAEGFDPEARLNEAVVHAEAVSKQ